MYTYKWQHIHIQQYRLAQCNYKNTRKTIERFPFNFWLNFLNQIGNPNNIFVKEINSTLKTAFDIMRLKGNMHDRTLLISIQFMEK